VTATPPSASASWKTAATVSIFFASLLLTLHGFVATPVIDNGLLQAWHARGVRQYVTFVALSCAVVIVCQRLRRPRASLAVAVVAWIVIANGIGAAAGLVFMAAGVLAIGRMVRRTSSGQSGRCLEGALLDAAVGTALLVSLVQASASLPVHVPALYFLLFGIPIAVERGALQGHVAAIVAFLRASDESAATYLTGGLLCVLLGLHSVCAAMPEAVGDAMAMHLMIPHQIAVNLAWEFDFHSYVWALLPMAAEWLYTAANLVGGEAVARLCNLGLLCVLGLFLFGVLRERLSAPLALFMVAAAAAAPIVFQESFSLWVENLLSVFLVASALLLARSWRRPVLADVVAFALCAGAAMSTKFLGLFVLPFVAMMGFSIVTSHARVQRRMCQALIGLAVLIAVGAFPYARAWIATGNPLFPFFTAVFPSPYLGVDFVDDRWIGHGGWDVLYQMTFRSGTFGELYDGAFGFQHLALLPLGVGAAFTLWPRPVRVGLAAVLILLVLFLSKMQYIRYLYPFLWGALWLEAEAVRVLIAIPRARWCVLATVGAVLVANLSFLACGYYLLGHFPVNVVLSRDARSRFIADEVPLRKVNETISALAGTRARVLYLTDSCGAFLLGRPIYSDWVSPEMARKVAAVASIESAMTLLSAHGITHVIINRKTPQPFLANAVAARGVLRLSVGGQDVYEIGGQP
jgi:hypothetical protein